MARAPSAQKRAKPGSRGGGRFFHIELRPSNQFVAFRVQDIPEAEKPTPAMRKRRKAVT